MPTPTPTPPAGSLPVHRPGRSYRPLPAVHTIEIAAPPVADDEPEAGPATAVLAAVLAAGSGAGFALVSGDPRYLAVCLVLAVASLATGWATRRSAARARERKRERVRAAYLAHLDAAGAHAREAAHLQREALELRYPSARQLCSSAPRRDPGSPPPTVWQRRPGHADFGTVRLGTGPVPARVTTATPGSPQPFDASAEPLRAAARAIVDGTQTVPGCPVLLDLRATRCVAVVGPPQPVRGLLRSWVVQLALTHAPADLLVVVARAEHESHSDARDIDGWDRDWEWARWLPHTQVPPRTGGGQGLARAARTVGVRAETLGTLLAGGPRWAVVVDRPGPAARVAPIGTSAPAPTTYLVACSDDRELPVDCDLVVRFGADGTCSVAPAGPDERSVDGILPDGLDTPDAYRTALAVAPLVENSSGPAPATSHPTRDEALPLPPDEPVALTDVLADAAPLPPMVVPLGRGADGSRIDLDLRESAAGGDGPHGVLVGATGSGKSELLRSLVLALAARAGPEDLSLVMVDFKGGATFDPLSTLPHVAGLLTNLADDIAGIARFQQSLEGELDDRQRLLRAVGCESVRELRERHGTAAPPDLLVVVDEFGELLEVRPDLLDTFGRIGRLGRSLAVHLLLASQRLDEGRLRGLESHLGYRIALRTYTAPESMAVLGTPAAHALPPSPGLGILRTAAGIRAFRAASASTPAPDPTDAPPVEVARRLAAWSPTAPVVRPTGRPTQLATLVDAIRAGTTARARPVCLPALPERIALAELTRTYPGPGVALGIVDLPASRRQEPLRIDLAADGHLAVVGSGRSGRSTMLLTLAAALAATDDPTMLHLYALDLGGSLQTLRDLPHTAAVATGHSGDAVRHVLDELLAITAEQADPADSAAPNRGTTARSVLLVDDVGRLRREHPDADDTLVQLAGAGRRAGIHLAVTAARWTDLRPALLDSVGTRLELHLDELADSRWPRTYATTVPPGPGGGLSPDGSPMRLALADGREPLARHPDGRRAPAVVPLPLRITEDAVATTGTGPADQQCHSFLLGVRERRTAPVRLPLLSPGSHLVLLGDRGSGRTTQLLRAANWLAGGHHPDDVRLHLVDPRRSLLSLAGLPHVAAHAYDPESLDRLVLQLATVLHARRPPPGLPLRDLAARGWWSGPTHVLVVDDQDLLPGGDGPGNVLAPGLTPLAGFLPHAGDIGWHVLLARPVIGLARASYDTFLTRLREYATATLVLSGDRTEGPVAGGFGAVPRPPGRGRLLRASGGAPAGELVQCALPDRPADA